MTALLGWWLVVSFVRREWEPEDLIAHWTLVGRDWDLVTNAGPSTCHAAGMTATPHQLRHTHATAMVDGGISLATIRKRLGHANLQTVLRYADQSDHTADTELRAWRRHRA